MTGLETGAFSGAIQKKNLNHNLKRYRVMKTKLMSFLRDEDGLTTVEYAIAGGLVGAAVIAAFQALGLTVGGVILNINGLLAAAP